MESLIAVFVQSSSVINKFLFFGEGMDTRLYLDLILVKFKTQF